MERIRQATSAVGLVMGTVLMVMGLAANATALLILGAISLPIGLARCQSRHCLTLPDVLEYESISSQLRSSE